MTDFYIGISIQFDLKNDPKSRLVIEVRYFNFNCKFTKIDNPMKKEKLYIFKDTPFWPVLKSKS